MFTIDGWLASSSGALLAGAQQTAQRVINPSSAGIGGASTLGIGLIAAVLLLAYWYRRVL